MSTRVFLSPREPACADATCGELGWDTLADCRHCAVRQQALFAALRGPDFEHIFQPIRSALVRRETVLYREDQAADAVYTVRRGMLKLTKRTPAEGVRIVRLLGRGAATGLEALTHGLYWHTAISVREAELCRIPLSVFHELQAHNVQLADRLVAQWEQQVNSADRWLAELQVGPIQLRVQRLLLVLTEIAGEDAHHLHLPPMADLASILGASRESVSRVLAELKRRKALTRVAPRTYECDPRALP